MIKGDPMAALARWVKYNYGTNKCLDFSYQSYVNELKVEEWNRPGTNSGSKFHISYIYKKKELTIQMEQFIFFICCVRSSN